MVEHPERVYVGFNPEHPGDAEPVAVVTHKPVGLIVNPVEMDPEAHKVSPVTVLMPLGQY